MEFSSIIIIIIIVAYLSKNKKGKQILDNVGDTAVELSAASKSAATALHKQCDELLMSDEEAEAKSKAVKAKLAAAKAKAKKAETVDNYEDAE